MSAFSRNVGRPLAEKYEYVINRESPSRDQYFGSDITYNDILLSKGPDAQDWTDISQVARRVLEPYSETLSNQMNPFYDMIASNGGVIEVDTPYVRYKTFGRPEREIKSYGNPNADGVDCLGAQHTLFKVRLNTPFLKPGNLIAPNEALQAQVMVVSECVSKGGAYEYDVQLSDADAIFPDYYFKTGQTWVKLGALTGNKKAGQAGGVEFGTGFSYIQFEIPITEMQWSYSVDEESYLAAEYLKIQRCRREGEDLIADKYQNGGGFVSVLDMEFKETVKRETELYIVHGEGTSSLVDTITGDEIKAGPGLFRFMRQARTCKISPNSNGIDKMMAELQLSWFDKVAISNRNLVLQTGELGAQWFNDWVTEKYGNTVTTTKEDMILQDTAPFAPGAAPGKGLRGFMFTRYDHPTWGTIRISHWPLLDNTRINGVKIPGTIYPATSGEFWAFDIGFGEPNIRLINRRNKERSLYYVGTIAPNGPVGPNNPIWKTPSPSMGDRFEYRYRKAFGLVAMRMDAMIRFVPALA